LASHPARGIFARLEDHSPLSDDSRDNSTVYQEEQKRDASGQGHLRPVRRRGQVVFEAQSRIPKGFAEQRFEMLIVPMTPKVRQTSRPEAG